MIFNSGMRAYTGIWAHEGTYNRIGIFMSCERIGCEFAKCGFVSLWVVSLWNVSLWVCELMDCEFKRCEFVRCEFGNCELWVCGLWVREFLGWCIVRLWAVSLWVCELWSCISMNLWIMNLPLKCKIYRYKIYFQHDFKFNWKTYTIIKLSTKRIVTTH